MTKTQMNTQAQESLDEYLATLSAAKRDALTYISADHFCSDMQAANICAELVRTGVKVATCSQKRWYQSGEIPTPQVGHLLVVTNWQGEPTSIIEITSVTESRFCDVGEDFAFAEGEGDRTLADWRRTHWAFFKKECLEIGELPTQDMELVLERFKVVYLKPN